MSACIDSDISDEDLWELLNPAEFEDPIFGKVVYAYTRKQALEDGFQVAIDSKTSREAGITFPVFMTREVWDQYVEVPEKLKGMQDEAGRLWDILWMLRCAIRGMGGGDKLFFQLKVRLKEGYRNIRLKSLCGPIDIDDPQPSITIMMPDQD